jgi:seryl-tRNA synthetase
MLQLATLRENKERVKQRLAVKHFTDVNLVDEIIALDDERKRLTFQYDETKSKINAASKEIGMLMSKGQKEEAEARKKEVESLKGTLSPIDEELKKVEQQLNELLVRLPNLPSDKVPAGKTPADNETVKTGGSKPELHTGAVPHWDLAKKYDLIDFELGNKITGSGFPVYKGKGAKLQRAMIQYFLDYNTKAGYTEYMPPHMVNEDSAYGTGQLPDKEGQMYHVTGDNLYLIPTAEVPVTNIYRDVILKSSELPVKMTAYTPCFRREAGSYGKDVRGLNRLHQFDKVEIVQLVQTNRMKIRYKDEKKGKTQLVHSLNGSSLALPRILACLLENNQTENGIMIPVALHSYFGSEMI